MNSYGPNATVESINVLSVMPRAPIITSTSRGHSGCSIDSEMVYLDLPVLLLARGPVICTPHILITLDTYGAHA